MAVTDVRAVTAPARVNAKIARIGTLLQERTYRETWRWNRADSRRCRGPAAAAPLAKCYGELIFCHVRIGVRFALATPLSATAASDMGQELVGALIEIGAIGGAAIIAQVMGGDADDDVRARIVTGGL